MIDPRPSTGDTDDASNIPVVAGRIGSAREVFFAFLKLGLTSFGGPVAHLGFFRTEFVDRRRWLDDQSYSDLVALCQFLPGPASSQVGMALGLLRAGWAGALCAWVGFTVPSALLLIAFAYGVAQFDGLAASGALSGLKAVVVAVVAQAVWGMGKSLCPDRSRAALAILGALLCLAVSNTLGPIAAIIACGLAGARFVRLSPALVGPSAHYGISRRAAVIAAIVFLFLLSALPVVVMASGSPFWALVDGVYRAGALVFGGGHVVLPLLQTTVVSTGMLDASSFIAGYGAAQVVPGPLFTFAAYLGTVMQGPLSGWVGGLFLLIVIFVPAFLLVVAALPFWDSLRRHEALRRAMAGVNAGVVGVLLAALYDPVWTSAIHGRGDVALALAAFALLVYARRSPVLVVGLGVAAGILLG